MEWFCLYLLAIMTQLGDTSLGFPHVVVEPSGPRSVAFNEGGMFGVTNLTPNIPWLDSLTCQKLARGQ